MAPIGHLSIVAAIHRFEQGTHGEVSLTSFRNLILAILAIVAGFSGLGVALKSAASLDSNSPLWLASAWGVRLRQLPEPAFATAARGLNKHPAQVAAEQLAIWLRDHAPAASIDQFVNNRTGGLQAFATLLSGEAVATAGTIGELTRGVPSGPTPMPGVKSVAAANGSPPAGPAAGLSVAPAPAVAAVNRNQNEPGEARTPATAGPSLAAANAASSIAGVLRDLPRSAPNLLPAQQVNVAQPKAAVVATGLPRSLENEAVKTKGDQVPSGPAELAMAGSVRGSPTAVGGQVAVVARQPEASPATIEPSQTIAKPVAGTVAATAPTPSPLASGGISATPSALRPAYKANSRVVPVKALTRRMHLARKAVHVLRRRFASDRLYRVSRVTRESTKQDRVGNLVWIRVYHGKYVAEVRVPGGGAEGYLGDGDQQ